MKMPFRYCIKGEDLENSRSMGRTSSTRVNGVKNTLCLIGISLDNILICATIKEAEKYEG